MPLIWEKNGGIIVAFKDLSESAEPIIVRYAKR